MKIHLIPDETLDADLYARVLGLLQAIPGVNKFYPTDMGRLMLPEEMYEDQEIPDKEFFEKQRIIYHHKKDDEFVMRNMVRTWDFPHTRKAVRRTDLFKLVQDFRDEQPIPAGEFTILLTPTANQKNWFAMLDEARPFNGFIHTDEWEHFIACNPAFPIAFEVVVLCLQHHLMDHYREIPNLRHERSIGCVSDLCMKKSDIILKMRTADICAECMQPLKNRLSLPEIHHALAIMESLRMKMLFSQNFRQTSQPSRMVIQRGGRIYLPDYGNLEIKFPTMEKALYFLFLRHPEGIYISSLNEHKQALYDIYSRISSRGMMEDMRQRIDELTNVLREQASVKISRIKRAFTDAIGHSLADHYIIQGDHAERKMIKIDRGLVEDKLNTK
jgi:hypothetical protein